MAIGREEEGLILNFEFWIFEWKRKRSVGSDRYLGYSKCWVSQSGITM
jgi:hypothetical protein